MAYVVCKISDGLRPSEVTVEVRDMEDFPERLRVPRDFVKAFEDRNYLPIGIVYHDRDKDLYLIEYPHEADSGTNRSWIRGASIFDPRPRREAVAT
jgi:hypothetical protein